MKKLIFLFLIIGLFPSFCWAKLPNDPNVLQWSFNDIKAYDAWDIATGSREVVVALIDNGFDTFHPDLIDNIWKNIKEIPGNNLDDDNNGYVDDVYGWNFVEADYNKDGLIDENEKKGNNDPRPDADIATKYEKDEGYINHGTLVAGLIGAVGDNNLAGAGLNWAVKLMNIKAVATAGNGSTMKPVSEAIHYAVDNGADIINISMVGDPDPELKLAVKYAYENGVAVFAAAGNSMSDLNLFPVYPACADAFETVEMIIGVSAINEDHRLARFSNSGSSCVDITAPGVNVSSTVRFSPTNNLISNYEGGFNGTSFASPLVAGTAALLKSIHPEWGPKEIYRILLKSVHHTPSLDETGYAELFGAGLLQTGKAVEQASEILRTAKYLKNIFYINNEKIVNYNIRINKTNEEKNVKLKGFEQIKSFLQDGRVVYVGLQKKDKKNNEVLILDNNYNVVNRWSVSAKGEMDLAVGKLAGQKDFNIFISPKYADKNVVRIFEVNGKEVNKYDLPKKHNGVLLSLVYNPNTKEVEPVALYSENGQVAVHHFNNRLILMDFFPVFIQKPVVIGTADLNGDGLSGYAVGDSNNEIYYYSNSGTLLRQFFAYDPNNKGKLQVEAGDFDNDGKDDVIFYLKNTKNPVVIYNGNARRIYQVQPFELGQLNNLFILGV